MRRRNPSFSLHRRRHHLLRRALGGREGVEAPVDGESLPVRRCYGIDGSASAAAVASSGSSVQAVRGSVFATSASARASTGPAAIRQRIDSSRNSSDTHPNSHETLREISPLLPVMFLFSFRNLLRLRRGSVHNGSSGGVRFVLFVDTCLLCHRSSNSYLKVLCCIFVELLSASGKAVVRCFRF